MIELYILGGFGVLVLGLFSWGKIASASAKQHRARADELAKSLRATDASIKQNQRINDNIDAVRQKLNTEHAEAQANVDKGSRDAFDNTTF